MDKLVTFLSGLPLIPIAIGFGVLIFGILFFFLRIAWRTRRSPDYETEATYEDEKGLRKPFPSIHDAPTRLVSVVVPAYKESKRIGSMMTDMLNHLREKSKAHSDFTWEIVIVDDGSPPQKDGTPDPTAALVQKDYVNKLGSDNVRLCKLYKNLGKGGAVRKGTLRTRGKYIIFADADGATQASDLYRLYQEIQKIEKHGDGIAVGSRRHADEEKSANRTIFRKLLGWCFHTLIKLLVGGHDIQDTQCGFKMFTRKTAARIFSIQHIERWAFDVELLFLAAHFGVPMVEVPVTWNEIDGSTLNPIDAAIQMARDVFIIRLAYLFGIWKYTEDHTPMVTTTNIDNTKKNK